LKLGFALAMVLTVGMSTASAQFNEDPATLHIGGALGNNTLDPVQLGNTGFVTVTNVSSGAGDLNVPWLLILGIPDATSTSATITSVNGATTSISGTYEASMTSSTKDAYTVLQNTSGSGVENQVPLDNSNNWTNWSGAESSINGIHASSFGLFEFQVPQTLSGGGTDTFQFSGLPVGAFVIAYGETGPDKNGKFTPYDTPFTQAGLETGTNTVGPAPPGLALVLSGCAAFGMFSLVRRRKPIAHAA
jgi:hypothetical protein